jgi:hypothetical protein
MQLHIQPQMHAKSESRTPPSKTTMSLFSNLLHTSTHSTLPADRPKIVPTPSQTEHQSVHQFDYHHVSTFLISLLNHMFAPVAYQQCTSSTPCWVPSHHVEYTSKSSNNAVIIVDDELVLLEDDESEEQDGGPLCREATIESWKAPKKGLKRKWCDGRWSELPYFGGL